MSKTDYGDMFHDAGPLRVNIMRSGLSPLIFDKSLLLHRLALECWQCSTYIHEHKAATHILMFVRSGACELHVNDQVFIASTGMLAAVPKGSLYSFRVCDDDDCEHVIMNVDGLAIDRWWRSIRSPGAGVFQLHRLNKIEALIEMVLDHLSSELGNDRWTAGHLFQSCLSVMSVDITTEVHEQKSAAVLHAEQAHAFINEHFQTVEDIDQIADHCGVHPDYLRRCYRARYHEGPARYLRRRKMEFACHQLSETADPLADIAEQIGYSDSFTFSKSFKQIIGMAPSVWRQQFRLVAD